MASRQIPEGLMTSFEASKITGIDPSCIRRACQSGRLVAEKIPAPWVPYKEAWVFTREALDAYARRYRPQRLNFDIAEEMRRLYFEEQLTQQAIANRYGVDRSTVEHAVNRRSWKRRKP